MRRGLFRAGVVSMILWNLVVGCWLVKLHRDMASAELSLAIDRKEECLTTKAKTACETEFQVFLKNWSQWGGITKEFSPISIAAIELTPPMTIGLLWAIFRGLLATGGWVLRGFGRKTLNPGIYEKLQITSRWFRVPRNIAALSLALAAMSISHYYLWSLPKSNQQRLQSDQKAAAAAKTDRDRREEEAAEADRDRDMSFQSCSAEVDNEYWSYVKLNGKEDPKVRGKYIARIFVWNTADKQKLEGLAECHRQYDRCN